jgi:hypothetical protein
MTANCGELALSASTVVVCRVDSSGRGLMQRAAAVDILPDYGDG